MTYYYFEKIKIWGEEHIIIFEQGKLSEPTLLLDQENIKRFKEALKDKCPKCKSIKIDRIFTGRKIANICKDCGDVFE